MWGFGLDRAGSGWWRAFVNEVMNLRVQWNAGNFFTRCKPVRFTRRALLHRGKSEYFGTTSKGWSTTADQAMMEGRQCYEYCLRKCNAVHFGTRVTSVGKKRVGSQVAVISWHACHTSGSQPDRSQRQCKISHTTIAIYCAYLPTFFNCVVYVTEW